MDCSACGTGLEVDKYGRMRFQEDRPGRCPKCRGTLYQGRKVDPVICVACRTEFESDGIDLVELVEIKCPWCKIELSFAPGKQSCITCEKPMTVMADGKATKG